MSTGRILVIEDKDSMRDLVAKILGGSFEVTTAADAERGLAMLAGGDFDVVLTDIRLPGADGFSVLRTTRERHSGVEVVLMTAFATIAKAVEAMKDGAFDYVQKPFEPDELRMTVLRAYEHKRLRDRAAALTRELEGRYRFDRMVGGAPAMQAVYDLIDKVATRETTVLVSGPSGSGKELVARAIHYASRRRDGPLVAINCGALPESLLESELFGHARGAFTGATGAKRGLFEAADGGTLFLDEINSLPLGLQVKLNRALEDRAIRRVGETREIAVDIRVIAASNTDLDGAVAAGTFREDLLYRLNVYPIHLPPLNERVEDIPLLLEHFLAASAERRLTGVTTEALRVLLRYSWPGNVRELQNVVERALIVEETEMLTTSSLPPQIVSGAAPAAPLGADLTALTYREVVDLARDRVSRSYLEAILEASDGNVTRAAERAGMERESLHRLLKKYGVQPDDYR